MCNMDKIIYFVIVLTNIANAYRSAFDADLYESVINMTMCDEQLNFLVTNKLGLKFFDSSAKLPSGILSGNTNDLGDYFQCLSIDEFINDMEIKGKYCTVQIPIDLNYIEIPDAPDIPDLVWPNTTWFNETWSNWTWPSPPLEFRTIENWKKNIQLQIWGRIITGLRKYDDRINSRVVPAMDGGLNLMLAFCIPKVCSITQVMDFIQGQLIIPDFKYTESFCRLPNDKPFVLADYVATCLFGSIACLLLVSTIYDLYYVFYLKRDAYILYRSFSVYTNTRRLLTFKSSPDTLDCMDGIRAISMAWVVVGHTFALTLFGSVHNLQDIAAWVQKFSSTWVNAAPITVDTFFLLSGILVVYTTIGKIGRSRFIRSIHLFYLNRFLRMFPLLATIVLLQASLFHHMSDGPLWINFGVAVENCREYWWSTLLHFQNYINFPDLCLYQTWYLSVDVQLYLLSPLVLVWLFDNKKLAWASLTFAVLLSLISTSVYSFMYNFSASLVNIRRLNELGDYTEIYYMNTLTRASPFCVGMMYGYLLHVWKNRKVRISRITVIILWVLSLLMMAFCIFTIYPISQPEHDAQIFDNFLNAYMRAIWAGALGWLIFACVKGYGGPINWFLSLRMWKLLARLSYAMYLIHFSIIMIANSSWVKPHYFTNGDTLYRFMSDFSLSFLAAFVLCVTIDAPFSILQRILFGGGARTPLNKPKGSKQPVENGLSTHL